jgi:hypothetical protein
MIVKEILEDAMRLTGREGLLSGEESGGESLQQVKYTMLFCLNAVVDELARGYFPVKKIEDMTSETGKFCFSDFSERPLKILKVLSGERKIGWHILPEYLVTGCEKVTVEYEYAPKKFAEEDEFDYPDPQVSSRLISYGMAAEFMLICGEVESSSCWEQKYRQEIDRLLSLRTVKDRIPPRRWL